jgi:hypothetical protein
MEMSRTSSPADIVLHFLSGLGGFPIIQTHSNQPAEDLACLHSSHRGGQDALAQIFSEILAFPPKLPLGLTPWLLFFLRTAPFSSNSLI